MFNLPDHSVWYLLDKHRNLSVTENIHSALARNLSRIFHLIAVYILTPIHNDLVGRVVVMNSCHGTWNERVRCSRVQWGLNMIQLTCGRIVVSCRVTVARGHSVICLPQHDAGMGHPALSCLCCSRFIGVPFCKDIAGTCLWTVCFN